MPPLFELLFFGDIVGKSGRRAVAHYLANHPAEDHARIVVANGENATHGFGLSESHYQGFLNAGIDVITGGNHIWDRKDIVHYIGQADRLLRPHNMPGNLPGSGVGHFDIRGIKFSVVNLIGQVYMANYNAPWEGLDEVIRQCRAYAPTIFIDFHAEATAEKLGLAHYCQQLGVSGFVGTHTHVQTADNQLIGTSESGTMGYLTDAGFNGAKHSVIGMQVDCSLLRMKSLVPSRMEVADSNHVQVNGARFLINPANGHCQSVERINTVLDLPSA